jgi:phosphoribosylamine---glycine ligase
VNIAVIGSGGREHAILRKLAHGSTRHELFAVPGNGGTEPLARTVPVDAGPLKGLLDSLSRIEPDLVIVGPEIPLAAGIADELTKYNIACFGPTAAAARIESSKVFAKELMRDAGVPTANFVVYEEFKRLARDVRSAPDQPWVVKADGLAAGKGAFVCDNRAQTLEAAHAMLVDGVLGAAGRRVVLEERMCGREASCMFWCDGTTFSALPVARDYKRALDGDAGPNTGGMSSLCPAPGWNDELQREVEDRIVQPVIRALSEQGCPFVGILYAGLMLTESGPQVIEFNCRLGDPETQTILAVWNGDFAEHAMACVRGRLAELPPVADSGQHAVSIVLAADGYPDKYAKGIVLRHVPDGDDAYTLHAGTQRTETGVVSSGGRVLNAVGVGSSLSEARERAYALAAMLRVPGLRYRTDIAR